MQDRPLTGDQRADLRQRLRAPGLCFIGLMALLGLNVVLGATAPFADVWILEALVVAAMVSIVLLFSMEIIHEPPLVRLFSALGFCWVAILIGMTLIDYLTR